MKLRVDRILFYTNSIKFRKQHSGIESCLLLSQIHCDWNYNLDPKVGPGGIARPFSTQIISVNRDVKQISVGFKKVTVEASDMTVGYMTV